ncbi:hypothetical protein BDQ17DRAFT_1345072 [Cyathus striatus]|nr:hypothetical protein BDQ17DRAFT_1345072 [Cyathus striatus]
MTDLHIQELDSTQETLPRVKPIPKTSSIPVPFSYASSDDGTDENLLILLHGLVIYEQLRIPYLYEDAYQWYPSFDDLGEIIERPNPTVGLDLISKVVDYLIKSCQWPLNRIHLFGFAQGGSVAAEFGLHWWKKQLQVPFASPTSQSNNVERRSPPPASSALGSIVTVSGPLLSYPTMSTICPTPVLVTYRPPPGEPSMPPNAVAAFKKAYQPVFEEKLGTSRQGMPASKEEWEPIMRFWSEKLGRRRVDGLYEVMSGMTVT